MGKRSRQDLLKIRALASLAIILGQIIAPTDAQQTADVVCSPQLGCIEGRVSAKGMSLVPLPQGRLQLTLPLPAGALLNLTGPPATSANSSIASRALLLPGTYSQSPSGSGSSSAANLSLLAPFFTSSTSTAQAGFSLSTSGSSISISQSSGIVVYSSSLYSGQTSFLAFNDSYTQNATTSSTPLSLMISPDVYAVARVPVKGRADRRLTIWNAVPDINELPVQAQNGQWTIEDLQGNRCGPPCASGGLCSLAGQCLCAAGFTGPTCGKSDTFLWLTAQQQTNSPCTNRSMPT